MSSGSPTSLARFAWLSIAASIVTITLKTVAYRLTGSVGLLSDALESLVNLAAAAFTLGMLAVAAKPPSEDHAYGYGKAEYFASGLEGLLILVAAGGILWAAVQRFLAPQPITDVGWGLAVSAAASVVNFGVARVLLVAARRHHSIALEADAHHLLTDVWTSVGVIAAVAGVAFSGWQPLDPAIAVVVALQIVWTGIQLVRRSAQGLLDRALAPAEQTALQAVLDRHRTPEIQFHAVRTRQAGARRFVSMHVLVPGTWTVRQGHDLCERLEAEVSAVLPSANVFTHLEAVEDPVSFEDQGLDRPRPGPPPPLAGP
jgi:cation diffusion facilitator family transporter